MNSANKIVNISKDTPNNYKDFDISSKLGEVQDAFISLRKDKEISDRTNKDMSEQLKEAKQTIEDMIEGNRQIKQKYLEMTASNEDLQTKNSALHKEIDELAQKCSDYDELKHKKNALEDEVDTLKAQNVRDKEQLNAEKELRIMEITLTHEKELEEVRKKTIEEIEAVKESDIRQIQSDNAKMVNGIILEHKNTVENITANHNAEIGRIKQSYEEKIKQVEEDYDEKASEMQEECDKKVSEANSSAVDKLNQVQRNHTATIGQLQNEIGRLTADIQKLEKLAYLDMAYNIPNKNAFYKCLSLADKPVCVIVVDICDGYYRSAYDNNKEYSRATKQVLEYIKSTELRKSVFVTGYEQLSFIIPKTDRSSSMMLLNKIRDAVAEEYIDVIYAIRNVANENDLDEIDINKELERRRVNFANAIDKVLSKNKL